MRMSSHGMVTIVATQSRPAMMRRVRERLGRLEKGWMIVRYLIENDCLISEKGRMISKYNNINGHSGSTIVAKVHAVSMTTYRPVKCNGSQRERDDDVQETRRNKDEVDKVPRSKDLHKCIWICNSIAFHSGMYLLNLQAI